MQISVSANEDLIELAPAGRIDQKGAPVFQEALLAHVEKCRAGGAVILVDMRGVDFISSVGLRAFMIASKTTRPAGGRLIAAGMNDVVMEVFKISRFDKVIECADNIEAVRASL